MGILYAFKVQGSKFKVMRLRKFKYGTENGDGETDSDAGGASVLASLQKLIFQWHRFKARTDGTGLRRRLASALTPLARDYEINNHFLRSTLRFQL
jgi:hypothetical protein